MKIARIISLANLGENHKDDFLKFSDISYREANDLRKLEGEDDATEFMDLLKGKLMGGSIVDDETGQPVAITADNFEDIPMSVLAKAISELVGGSSENLT